MKSAGGRVPINGTHFEVLWSELGVPFRVLPSLCHHLTLRLIISGPARFTTAAMAGPKRQN